MWALQDINPGSQSMKIHRSRHLKQMHLWIELMGFQEHFGNLWRTIVCNLQTDGFAKLSTVKLSFQGGEEIAFSKGDFWRTPGGVPHTMRAGEGGCRVLDIFAPPRDEYRKPGSGFGNG